MQAVSGFCIFLWLPEAEPLIQVINSGDSGFLFRADGDLPLLFSQHEIHEAVTWHHLPPLTISYRLTPAKRRAPSLEDTSVSPGDREETLQGFSLSLSSLLSPFLFVLFPTSLCNSVPGVCLA